MIEGLAVMSRDIDVCQHYISDSSFGRLLQLKNTASILSILI
jgi:hypothetical protein